MDGMHHLRWSAVSVKAKAEANLNFHRNRFCVFKNLVQDDTVSLLLKSAKAAEYHQIFNKFKAKTSDRRAAKACDLGNLVVAQILTFCQDCLIAGDSHILLMGRGASFLKSLPGCSAQDTHMDFDFESLRPPPGFRRRKPLSIWVALQPNSCLHLDGKPHPFNAGDVVVFSGDCHHSGAANEHAEPNYRLFSYVPTRGIDVPWDINHCSTNVRRAAVVVTDAALHEYLHRRTNPLDGEFDDNVFKDWLYDWATGKFYKFTVPVWLEGLDTAESRKGCAVSKGQHAEIADGSIKCKRCHHFDVDDFVPCDTTDRKKLNDFRSQCPCKRVRAACAQ